MFDGSPHTDIRFLFSYSYLCTLTWSLIYHCLSLCQLVGSKTDATVSIMYSPCLCSPIESIMCDSCTGTPLSNNQFFWEISQGLIWRRTINSFCTFLLTLLSRACPFWESPLAHFWLHALQLQIHNLGLRIMVSAYASKDES